MKQSHKLEMRSLKKPQYGGKMRVKLRYILDALVQLEVTGKMKFDGMLDMQAFNNGKQMAHSGMNASALYLFDRLFSLAKVWVFTP